MQPARTSTPSRRSSLRASCTRALLVGCLLAATAVIPAEATQDDRRTFPTAGTTPTNPATPTDSTWDLSPVGLDHGLVVTLESPVVADGGRSATVHLPTEDGVLELKLLRRSVRDRSFTFVAERAGGVHEPIEPTPVETYRGTVAGEPDSTVAVSILPEGVSGLVRRGTERLWVEPIGHRVPGAGPAHHVVYRADDVAPHEGVCGVSDVPRSRIPLAGASRQRMAIGGICAAQIAFDVDYPFYVSMNESLEDIGRRIELVLNTMNVQYNTQVGIDHRLTMILVRTSEVDDPYQDDIICDNQVGLVRAEWEGAYPFVVRDLVHLVSGRTYGTVVGCHYVGVVCDAFQDADWGFGLSQLNYSNNLSLSTNLIAHELGHGWGANHCACSNPPFTMNPTNNASNQFNEDLTVPVIMDFLDAWNDCLECAGEPTIGCGRGNSTCFNTSIPAAPFCEDEACCSIICAIDPFCCTTEWDATCVDRALVVCADCGTADSGNPFAANGTPGCTELDCCEAVCAIDAYCCSIEWDILCADKAITNCTTCGEEDAGSPYQEHGPGSDDRSCCGAICSLDPFCCTVSWDEACIERSVESCAGCGEADAGSPFLFNGTPGSVDAECCVAVCGEDPYCCETEWDNACARTAALRCAGWCRGDLDFDGKIGGADLAILIANWGSKSVQLADLDDDGRVLGSDLAILLGGWGDCDY